MPQIKPMTRRTWLMIATGLVACIRLPQAAAQNGADGQRPISIAVPDFSGSPGTGDASARDVTGIITSDLKASGRLVLIEAHGLEENLDAIPRFDRWRGIHAECLVTGRISPAPDQRVKMEFRLWDVASGHQLIGAQYMLQPEDWQRVAHVIAADIVKRLIG